MTGDGEDHRVFRPGGVSYLHIPAPDPAHSTAFYRAAFGWSIRDDEDSPAFEDGTGHVIGHFIRGLPVGHLPYVYVDSVDETLDKVAANGGAIMRPPFPEGDLWVATVEDPAGNLLGIWQRGPRARVGDLRPAHGHGALRIVDLRDNRAHTHPEHRRTAHRYPQPVARNSPARLTHVPTITTYLATNRR
jgi:uncharacterized protein